MGAGPRKNARLARHMHDYEAEEEQPRDAPSRISSRAKIGQKRTQDSQRGPTPFGALLMPRAGTTLIIRAADPRDSSLAQD